LKKCRIIIEENGHSSFFTAGLFLDPDQRKRTASEIWENPPKGLNFLNPAFETVSHDFIDGIISEAGVFSLAVVYIIVKEKYQFMMINE